MNHIFNPRGTPRVTSNNGWYNLQNIRKKNKENNKNVLLKAVDKHPYLAYKALIGEKCLLSRASYDLMENKEFRSKIIKKLIEKKEKNKLKFIIKNLLLEKGFRYENENKVENIFCIYTVNDIFLYFSVEKNDYFSPSFGFCSCDMVLYNKDENRFFYRNIYGDKIINKNIIVEKIDDMFFSIKIKNKYLSVQPDGRVECNRNSVSEWEKFLFIPLK